MWRPKVKRIQKRTDYDCGDPMPQLLPTLSYLLVLCLITQHSLASRVSCVKEYYGTPRSSDCDELLGIFADANDNQPRLFDDEQLRTPGGLSFPGVKNVYPDQVVQVPAYWSLSQYTDPLVERPSFVRNHD